MSPRCWTLPNTRVILRRAVFAVGVFLVTCPMISAQARLPPSPESSTAVSTTKHLLDDRPISSLKASLAAPTSVRPTNAARAYLQTKLTEPSHLDCGRAWCLSPYEWEAPNSRHQSLYFEEPELERLGYYYGTPQDGSLRRALLWPVSKAMELPPEECWIRQRYFEHQAERDENPPQLSLLQPMVSAANFYGRVVLLPYLWGVRHPQEEIYDLGEDNPGSPVPYRKHYAPLSVKGALYEGAAITGLGFLIP